MTMLDVTTWVPVIDFDDLPPDRGVCALVGPWQVALFRVTPTDELFAVSNFDPFSRAYVLSRGIVGTRGDVVKVASPIFKQNFDLRTGKCLDDPTVSIRTFDVRVNEGGEVEVGVAVLDERL